jgi:ubiquinone/menaquinone biosynthesis C-methylase UbiE
MPFKNKRYRHDDEDRRKWQNPEAILAEMGLTPGMVFADLGSGEGFFALPAARIVGSEGRVYALDSDAEGINHLKKTAAEEGLVNVIAVAGQGESTMLCEECADIVFLGTVLHDFADAAMVLRNARTMIKPTGKLVNLDWKKEQTELGPPVEIRFDEGKASRLISEAGFQVEKVWDIGPYHYVVTAKPVTLPQAPWNADQERGIRDV